jgi:hypothetical protein
MILPAKNYIPYSIGPYTKASGALEAAGYHIKESEYDQKGVLVSFDVHCDFSPGAEDSWYVTFILDEASLYNWQQA